MRNPVIKDLKKNKIISDKNLEVLSNKVRNKKNIKVFQDKVTKVIFLEKFLTGRIILQNKIYIKKKVSLT